MTKRASEVLNANTPWPNGGPISDHEIETDCEQCGRVISLGSCKTEQTDEGLVYRCGSCPEVVLIVADFIEGTAPWPGRGYRLDRWVVRNVAPLRFRGIVLDAMPHATTKKLP